MSRKPLSDFLVEVINMDYYDYLHLKEDPNLSENQSLILVLVDAIRSRNLRAMKLAINRIDGALTTPVEFIFPKVYTLYPYATAVEEPDVPADTPALNPAEGSSSPPALTDTPHVTQGEVIDSKDGFKTLGLREVIVRLGNARAGTVASLLDRAREVHEYWLGTRPVRPPRVPVKSVLAAHLYDMAQDNDLDAIIELFNQVEGKMVQRIKLLGNDMFFTSYDRLAPAGATKNEDDIYMIEDTVATQMWARGLSPDKTLEMIDDAYGERGNNE